MAIFADWIKQTVSGTPGTGVISLGSAVSNFIRLADDTRIVDGSLVYYTIEDGVNRERGIGTYSTTGPTLTRTTIHAKLESGTYSENPGTGLTLTSAAIVSCSPVARALNKHGAFAYNSTAYSLASGTSWVDIPWTATDLYDTLGFHDTGTNPERMTIPSGSGITKVRLLGNIEFAANATGYRRVRIAKNGAVVAGGGEVNAPSIASAIVGCFHIETPPLVVVPGDYFTLQAMQNSGSALNIGASGTDGSSAYFAIEVLE